MKAPYRATIASLVFLIASSNQSPAEETFSRQSSQSGNWSHASTWKEGKVPKEGDRVLISPRHTVRYDAKNQSIFPLIHINGVLRFSLKNDTELNAGVIRVGGKHVPDQSGVADVMDHDAMPRAKHRARLEVGTADQPIPAGKTARIRLHFLEGMDKEESPVITCRPGGRMDFHGAPMSRTWADLGNDASPGARRVELSVAVAGWRAGDQIVITGDKRASSNDDEFTSEERTISSIEGKTIKLDKPLKYTHSGSGSFRCEVANLSRNVIVESANPSGVRGHTMYHRHSAGSISYARFAGLGKKDTLGRYPIHFHMVRDTLRGASVIGAAIVDSENRWIAIHNTQYLVVRDCVGYRSVGHGFFLEDGTEVYNVLDRNLGIQAEDGKRLPDQALPFDPNDGAAFWWANGRNTFVRNVSCENETYGYRYDSQKRSNFDSNLKIRMPNGKNVKTDIRTLPIYRFEDNEAHTEGLYGFTFAGTEGEGPDKKHPHRLKGTTVWNVHYALRAQLPRMLVEETSIERAAYGIYRPWFEDHVYKNLTISRTNTEPFNRGLDDKSLQHGSITVDGLTFANFSRSSSMPLIQISAFNPSGKAETHVRNLRVENREPRNKRPLVNMGGGPRTKKNGFPGVPVIVHDHFGPGRHGRFVANRSAEFLAKQSTYREQVPDTGDESRVAEVTDAEFPTLLQPVDDQPPATVITWPVAGIPAKLNSDGSLTVRGTTTDDVGVARVIVNGVHARDVDYNFHQWEVKIPSVAAGKLSLQAAAKDKAGNSEQTPHVLEVELVRK